MACNCKNGQTFLNSCIPVAGGTAEDSTYMIDMTHYTCGNRKICVNGFYPPVANLNYQVVGTPQAIGNDVYVCDILITGQVTYMPYKRGQQQCGCCQPCPVTENVYCTISVPVDGNTIPALKGGAVNSVTPTNVQDCCNVTNAVSIVCSVNVSTAATAATGD